MKYVVIGCALAALAGVAAGQVRSLEELPALSEFIPSLPDNPLATTAQAAKPEPNLVNFAIVSEKATGYGKFTARQSSVFTQNEILNFYAEPVNFGWSAVGDKHRFSVVMDVEIRKPDGEIVWGKKGVDRVSFDEEKPRSDCFLAGNVSFSKLPPGKYILGVRFRDAANDRILERDVDFEIVGRKPGRVSPA